MPATLTFSDEFNSLSLWNGNAGTWSTSYWYHDLHVNGGSLPSNGEEQWYINANYGPTDAINPWTVGNGILTLTAAPADPSIQPLINGYKYTSGEINSYHSFSQTYGYFEMRAELPQGKGLWPAFWLLPADLSWPPEIDVLESIGDPTTAYVTAHSKHGKAQGIETKLSGEGFHTFAVAWDAKQLVWYVDGAEIGRQPTPPDANKPMYMLANMAMGGDWAGTPDATTPFPATYAIDYIRAYRFVP